MLNTMPQLTRDEISLHVLNEELSGDLINISSHPKIWELRAENFLDSQVFKEQWIDKAFKQMRTNRRICYVIYHKNKVAGSSSFYAMDEENKTVNIGYTWFHPDFWGGKINACTKLIMLEYVFEELKYHRVKFCVDSMNISACRSLEKYGIKKERVLRNHMILGNGRVRDSVVYSVIFQEWLEIKARIESFLG